LASLIQKIWWIFSVKKKKLLLAAFQFAEHTVDASGEIGELIAAGNLNAFGNGLALADTLDFAAKST
jgi:hypothetical protein